MLVNTKIMIGVPVMTQSGASLGRVASFDFEADTGELMAIHVKTRGLLTRLIEHELRIRKSDIIEITERSVTVKDASVSEDVRVLASKAPAAIPNPSISASTDQ